MKIDYADIVLLNDELKRRDTRYHIAYKNEQTACLEPPGECCLTNERETTARECVKEYYRKKNVSVQFSGDGLYFTCEAGESPSESETGELPEGDKSAG